MQGTRGSPPHCPRRARPCWESLRCPGRSGSRAQCSPHCCCAARGTPSSSSRLLRSAPPHRTPPGSAGRRRPPVRSRASTRRSPETGTPEPRRGLRPATCPRCAGRCGPSPRSRAQSSMRRTVLAPQSSRAAAGPPGRAGRSRPALTRAHGRHREEARAGRGDSPLRRPCAPEHPARPRAERVARRSRPAWPGAASRPNREPPPPPAAPQATSPVCCGPRRGRHGADGGASREPLVGTTSTKGSACHSRRRSARWLARRALRATEGDRGAPARAPPRRPSRQTRRRRPARLKDLCFVLATQHPPGSKTCRWRV
mmetsp:Transcript_39863/g.124344  ORF Transcript_39863/g.124344 Transcript_39863/m.124344 type:complete len:313 (-) Transcript_39863:817-1755(-)